MKTKLASVLLALVVATTSTGCENLLKEEHAKNVKKGDETWYKAKQGIQYEVALQQYKVGDYDKCRETLKTAINTAAPTGQILTLAAKVELEQNGSLERASAYLKQALTANTAAGKIDAEPYYLLGVVNQRWQQLETALEYYEQAMQKKANEATYVLAAAEMMMSLGQLDEAKDFLDLKMNYFESSAAMRIAMARIALLQNDPATAATEFREATLLSPDDRTIRWSYASALFEAGRYNESSKILESMRREEIVPVKSTNPKTSAQDLKADEASIKANKVALLMMLGESYVSLNRPLDARDCFQETIRMEPENKTAYISLGKACLLTKEYNLTVSAAKFVLRANPRSVDAMTLLAAAQQKQKKWSDALDTLGDAARLAPKDATILCMQGLSHLQLGKNDLAISYLEKAVSISPADAWANELLAQVKPQAIPAAPLPRSSSVVEPATSTLTIASEPAGGQTTTIPVSANTPLLGIDEPTKTPALTIATEANEPSGQ